MKRLFFILLSALSAVFTLGCPGNGASDGGTPDADEPPGVEITVSGTTYVYPLAAAYVSDAGLPAVSLAGLTLRMEEPLKVALKDPTGILGSQTLTSGGAFSFTQVPMDLVNLGLAAGVRDDSDAGTGPRVIRSATTLYDVALQGKKPDADLVGLKAWAVPTAFHEKLTLAVTAAKVTQVTTPKNPKSTLIEAGFILGQVVDSTGAPVTGAVITTSPVAMASQIVYPTADFSTTQGATSSNGLFIFIHDGDQQPVTFSFVVKDKPEYLLRKGGAALDACLLITVYPGKVAP